MLVGLLFALAGNVLIGTGNVLQKLAINYGIQSSVPSTTMASRKDQKGTESRPSASFNVYASLVQTLVILSTRLSSTQPAAKARSGTRRPYRRLLDPLWLLGFFLTYFGDIGGNWVALSMTSPQVVTPLGIIGVITNAILARDVLGEKISAAQKHGYIWICLGVVILIFAGNLGSDTPLQDGIKVNIRQFGLSGLSREMRKLGGLGGWFLVLTILQLYIGYNLYIIRISLSDKAKVTAILPTNAQEDASDDGSAHPLTSFSPHSTINRHHATINTSDRAAHQKYPASAGTVSPIHHLVMSTFMMALISTETVVTSKIITLFLTVPKQTPIPPAYFYPIFALVLVSFMLLQEYLKQSTLGYFAISQVQPTNFGLFMACITISGQWVFSKTHLPWWAPMVLAIGISTVALGCATMMEVDVRATLNAYGKHGIAVLKRAAWRWRRVITERSQVHAMPLKETKV